MTGARRQRLFERGAAVALLRFPERATVPVQPESGRARAAARGTEAVASDTEYPPDNLRFLLTPDHDPSLDYLDTLPDLDNMDDVEREARIAVARRTGS